MTGRREHPRDQDESEFTIVLRSVFEADPSALAVAFVDREGECVDYCGSVAPYDCKVAAATMQMTIDNLRPSLEKLSMGELAELHLHAVDREIVLRRLDAEYACVVIRTEGDDEAMLAALDRAVDTLREIAGMALPPWDAAFDHLEVITRPSEGWGFAPETVVERGAPCPVDAVLGRWEESGGLSGMPLVCFRVHMHDGRDETLVFDSAHHRWCRW